MGYDTNPNGSDLTIVTDVLQYSVFATLPINPDRMDFPPLVLLLLLVQYKCHKQGKKSSLNN